jgi:hypothetical protein
MIRHAGAAAPRMLPMADGGECVPAQARELGLEPNEAGLIAAALLAMNTSETLRQQVEDELTGRRLRAAQRLAAGLAAHDPLRQRIAAVDAEVGSLSRCADQELARGRREEAARLLAEAIGIAGDDPDLPGRLAALPPPPPRMAAARMDGDHVLVTWLPSPATVGQLHYRVVRGHNRAPAAAADGTAVVTQTVQNHVTDMAAPPAADLFYSVFASRGGDVWSPAAIVFTKMDAFLHDLKQTSPLRRLPAHGAHFDERDSLHVHSEIQRLLTRWDGARIDRIATQNYSSYRYFGVSALGEAPTSGEESTKENRVSPRGIRPYRVTDPFLWLLAHYGIIPVK